jgi:hypothetical protein
VGTTITIPLCPDTTPEAHDQFNVNLTIVSGPPLFDGTGLGTILNDDAVPAGSLLISEFRLNGPAGDHDEFIEIANTTSNPIIIGTVAPDLSSGFSVARAGGVPVFTIPNGTVIPARGHLLATNNTATTGYSLKDYGGTNAATPNRTWTTDIPPNVGLALFATADTGLYGTATPLDAVGFGGPVPPPDVAPYVEGTGLTPIGAFTSNYSFVRKYPSGVAAPGLQDTGVNSADFALVAADASAGALLGGPSPENLSAETERTNAQVTLSGNGSVFTGISPTGPKALEFRRTFTNNTGGTLTALRFKITSISTVNSPGGVADRRATSSTIFGSFKGLRLEHVPSPGAPGYSLFTAPSTGASPTFLPYGLGTELNGGLNSTWRLPAPVSLANLASVGVNFRVEYRISGVPFLVWVVPEAK